MLLEMVYGLGDRCRVPLSSLRSYFCGSLILFAQDVVPYTSNFVKIVSILLFKNRWCF